MERLVEITTVISVSIVMKANGNSLEEAIADAKENFDAEHAFEDRLLTFGGVVGQLQAIPVGANK